MGERRKVLVTTHIVHGRPAPYLDALTGAGFTVALNTLGRKFTTDELLARIGDCYATIANVERYDERVFRAAPHLRVIARWGVGYDSIDLATATRHGVAVAMAFGANHEAVADHALAFMGGLASRILPIHREIVAGGWNIGFRAPLAETTVGIVGLGRIGKAVARRCRAFAMRVLFVDPDPAAVAFGRAEGYEPVPLDVLLRQSDFVTLHAPATPATENLIRRDTLALMKPTAFLINTARGSLVDEAALHAALVARRIAGAALDVFRVEPPAGSPLLALENVLVSAHSATLNDSCERLVGERCARSILAISRGEDPGDGCLLNPEVLAGAPPATGDRP